MARKIIPEVKDGKLIVNGDFDADGQPLIKLSLNLSEAVQEILVKGEAKEGVKVAQIAFEDSKLKVKLDTDKDGESVLELELDVFEAIQEAGILK